MMNFKTSEKYRYFHLLSVNDIFENCIINDIISFTHNIKSFL